RPWRARRRRRDRGCAPRAGRGWHRARIPGAQVGNRLDTRGASERLDSARSCSPCGTGTPDRQHDAERQGCMRRTMLKSKIHRATVTGSDLHYVGSITIDQDLLDAADIREHEQVQVVDVDNGARFETYTISGERG